MTVLQIHTRTAVNEINKPSYEESQHHTLQVTPEFVQQAIREKIEEDYKTKIPDDFTTSIIPANMIVEWHTNRTSLSKAGYLKIKSKET